jgi:hypothetical protein
MRLAITILLALLALAAVPAASMANDTYPGQHGADVPETVALVRAGTAFWGHRGVHVPPVQLLTARTVGHYDDAGTVSPWGHLEPRCVTWPPGTGPAQIICRDDYLYPMLATIRNRHVALFARRQQLVDLCTVYFHELGHAGGLAMPVWHPEDQHWHDGHGEHGIMSAEMTTPGDCWAFAVAWLPRPRARTARTHHHHHRRHHGRFNTSA